MIKIGDIYIAYQELRELAPKIVHSNPDNPTYRWTLSETTEDLFYVATPQEIYAFSFGRSEVQLLPKPVYTVPLGEETTKAKLYIQGEYAARTTDARLNAGVRLDLNLRALLVTSQLGDEGVVRLLPMNLDFIGTGVLSLDRALEYRSFGKILDVISVGN